MFSGPTRMAAATLGAALSLIGVVASQAVDAATSRDKIDLRVLVTGIEGSKRLAEFREFLSAEFRVVGTTSYSGFRAEDAEGYDVVVFDAEGRPMAGLRELPKSPSLPKDFKRASVLVGWAGAILARPLGLKTDWG